MLTSSTRSFGPRTLCAAIVVCAAGVAALARPIQTFSCNMDGPSESPPNGSPGTGFATVDMDTIAHTMHVNVTFSGLLGTTTASHIHSATAVAFTGTAPVATQTPSFSGFPLGVTAGSYDHLFDMTLASSYNASFISAHGGTTASAEAFLFQSMLDGKAYLNIHTVAFGGGEIRGFLVPVPAPGAAAAMGIGALIAARRRRA